MHDLIFIRTLKVSPKIFCIAYSSLLENIEKMHIKANPISLYPTLFLCLLLQDF